MSYELLTNLYFGEAANADLASAESRRLLHVRTPLEDTVATLLARGLDVVLTGNPGDGKSHVAHVLREDGALKDVEIHPDLSAGPSSEAIERWLAAKKHKKRFLLLGNEGPLLSFLEALESTSLREQGAELRGQLRRLLAQRPGELAPAPRSAALIDLADRNVLDVPTIESMLHRVSAEEFLPDFARAMESSVGRNLYALTKPEVRTRLARLLCAAGRQHSEHVTFRQLWGAIAFAITGVRMVSTLRQELSEDEVGLRATPLQNLASPRGQGPLLDAVRRYADVAAFPDPELDEALWATGQPGSGEWLGHEIFVTEPPAQQYADGARDEALRSLAMLKRAVAMLHERGERLVERVERALLLPQELADSTLRKQIVDGLRHLYVSPSEAASAPEWLMHGVPLWVGLTYTDSPTTERPHVAVKALGEEEFELRRPVRAEHLRSVLGPAPDTVWLEHTESSISLPVTPQLLRLLTSASQSSGRLAVPEPVERFLIRLAGWSEGSGELEPQEYSCAVLVHPRGQLQTTARVRNTSKGARYA